MPTAIQIHVSVLHSVDAVSMMLEMTDRRCVVVVFSAISCRVSHTQNRFTCWSSAGIHSRHHRLTLRSWPVALKPWRSSQSLALQPPPQCGDFTDWSSRTSSGVDITSSCQLASSLALQMSIACFRVRLWTCTSLWWVAASMMILFRSINSSTPSKWQLSARWHISAR